MTVEKRKHVVAIAMSWLGTPYHHEAGLKGVGTDCALFPLRVYQEAGLIRNDATIPHYFQDWHLHRTEEVYLHEVNKYAHEVEKIPEPGDFVIWRIGRVYSHGTVVIDWPRVIHSVMAQDGVMLEDSSICPHLSSHPYKVFVVGER